MLSESDILYQNGDYWVCKRAGGGYEVLKDARNGLYSTVVATIGYAGEKGLSYAIREADKRSFNKI